MTINITSGTIGTRTGTVTTREYGDVTVVEDACRGGSNTRALARLTSAEQLALRAAYDEQDEDAPSLRWVPSMMDSWQNDDGTVHPLPPSPLRF